MKQAIGYFIAGIFFILWITSKWCTPGPVGKSGDTLSHSSDTVWMPGHDTVIIQKFYYTKEIPGVVPDMPEPEKDLALQDYYTERTFDSTLYQENNYRQRIRIKLYKNSMKEFFSDFENLRPIVVNATTILAPATPRFFLGASMSFKIDNQAGAVVVPQVGWQFPSRDLVVGGFSPWDKTIEVSYLWHPRFKFK